MQRGQQIIEFEQQSNIGICQGPPFFPSCNTITKQNHSSWLSGLFQVPFCCFSCPLTSPDSKFLRALERLLIGGTHLRKVIASSSHSKVCYMKPSIQFGKT
ncbi:hypothetical protein AVEN_254707-1 [Araneus ventricosus]|uniref:Uncharacterized protein n=1 Tax=Araneus ventricosus TaxID=182803 RepID=A0A4Y2K432_ARAVE|nr:hypothetical protein AVEN_254707-1 [Araneus ventricosus]